jgi:hypothetical protein
MIPKQLVLRKYTVEGLRLNGMIRSPETETYMAPATSRAMNEQKD